MTPRSISSSAWLNGSTANGRRDLPSKPTPITRTALEGAEFVVSAIEVGAREGLWKKDFEIPLKYGVRQPYAENGGPGGFAHAARNIGPVMEIVRDMEKVCPQAWFINFTNPMIRICDTVNRHSKIKAVGSVPPDLRRIHHGRYRPWQGPGHHGPGRHHRHAGRDSRRLRSTNRSKPRSCHGWTSAQPG